MPGACPGRWIDLEARDSSPSETVPSIFTGPPSQRLRKQRHPEPREGALELREVEVVRAAVALGVGDLVRVAEDRHAETRRGAAVVGMPVPEHDAVMPPSAGGDGARSLASSP